MDNDLNMRFFEALSIGRLLLSDKVDGQDELATDGEHYVSFSDWEDLDRKIEYYLKNETEREKIARAGADYVRIKHTYKDRLQMILEVMGFY
jgi:spore maturation protein CgeB